MSGLGLPDPVTKIQGYKEVINKSGFVLSLLKVMSHTWEEGSLQL